MAYGSAKGRIFRGDIYAEDDPDQDTYIDWGNDFISFGVGGVKVLNVSASDTLVQVLGNVSASLNITASGHVSASTAVYTHKLTASNFVSASTFYGDGSHLKGVTTSPASPTNAIQFNNAGAFGGTTNLRWDGSGVIMSGTLSASAEITGTSFYVPTTPGFTNDYGFFGNNLVSPASSDLAIKVGPDTTNTEGLISFSSAGSEKLRIQLNNLAAGGASNDVLIASQLGNIVLKNGPPGTGQTTISGSLSASLNITASAFYGDGSHLTNLPGGGGIFTTLASGGAFTTSSIRVGSAGEPSASLYVSGTGAGAGPVFRVDSSVAGGRPLFFVTGSGRVGIGTDAPEATLHISASVAEAKLLVASDAKAIELYPANGPAMGFGTPGDTDYYMKIGAFGGYNQIWLNNGSTDFQISGSTGGIGYYFDQPGGNIGIGTQSPAASLHVSSSRVDAVLRADGASGSVFVVSGSGRAVLDGAGINGITGSLLGGYFTTTSSYGSRLSLKGNGVGDTPGTEPYIQPVSSSYIIPSGAFDSTPGAGFPPFPIPMKYETLAITAPSGKAQGGNILISGSGDLHLNFTNFSNSMGMPFTNTFGSTMNFGSLTTTIFMTSSGMKEPWAIESPYGGMGGMPYAQLRFADGGDPGEWLFSHGDNPAGALKYFTLEELTASFSDGAQFNGSASFNAGLFIHSVPLTSNVGAFIGGDHTSDFQVVVTSSFANVVSFGDDVNCAANLTASGHVSASIFYGDGQYLKNLPGSGPIATTTGGGNNTLYLPFVSSSTGVGSATVFTDSAVALKPQSGSLILDGDGEVGVTGSLMGGYFTTTSSYGSRLSLKGAEVGDVAGTEPYVQVVSSSYIIPAGAFGGGQPPFDIPLKYETLEISAPNGHGMGAGNVQISGSGDLHLNFTNFSNSMGMPFTNTFGSTMEFGSLSTYIYTTSSKLVEPYGIFNGHVVGGGMPYTAIQMPPDTDPGQWLFSHGENGLKYFRVEELTASFDNIFLQGNASASFQGGTSFFGGLEIHAVPLTSNVGAQIGGGSANTFQVVVTSSFGNVTLFNAPIFSTAEASFGGGLTSNSNQLFISGAVGGGMVVNITSSNNNNSLFTGGGALLGHSGGGNADIRLFAGHSGQAGTISGSNLQLGDSAQIKGHVIAEGNLNTTGGNISGSGALMIGGNATVAGSTTLGTGPDNLTLNVNSVKTNASDVTWLLRSGSVGTGSGAGKNGPLMFYMTHSGGSTTDLLKFNTASGSLGVVFPTNFYPHQSNAVDMGNHDLAFRNVYANVIGSAGNILMDGVNAANGGCAIDMPNDMTEGFSLKDSNGLGSYVTVQTSVGDEHLGIHQKLQVGQVSGIHPNTTLDIHYTGSGDPAHLQPQSGGGEVVYFGTGSTVNVGGVHYLNSLGGWVPTNADATGSGRVGDGGHKQLLGIALGTHVSASGMLIRGFYNATASSPAPGYYMGDFQTGSAVYLQAQGAPGQGRMSGTAPTGSGQFVRVVGYATDTPHVIYFNPDSIYVELS